MAVLKVLGVYGVVALKMSFVRFLTSGTQKRNFSGRGQPQFVDKFPPRSKKVVYTSDGDCDIAYHSVEAHTPSQHQASAAMDLTPKAARQAHRPTPWAVPGVPQPQHRCSEMHSG